MPAYGLFQDGRPGARRGRVDGATLGLIGPGNNQLGDRAPARFGFVIAEQAPRAGIPSLDHKVGSDAEDGIVGGGNDCGKLGVAPLRHPLSRKQAELPHGAPDRAPQDFGVEALFNDVIECAGLHRCGGDIRRSRSREDHHGAWQKAIGLPQGLQHVEPVPVRQDVIKENAIDGARPGELQALFGVGSLLQHEPAGLECEPHGHTILGRVVDH